MDDRTSGHGFLTSYHGPNTSCLSTGLRRNTAYRFRLQALNDEGKSAWSEEAIYTTSPDAPSAPLRPGLKGRIHANSFKVRWDPPSDNGGCPISTYLMEMDAGEGWRTVYQGSQPESVCDNLRPGTLYKVRVACATEGGGSSAYSEECHLTTEPVTPGQCAPPRLHGKAKANSLHLKWGWPEYDGGAPVQEFEVDMTSCANQTRGVYKGRDTECVVASLLPGRPYLFQVRAHNRAGAGAWSESLEVVSGAGCPGQPQSPRVQCRPGSLALLSWEPPINNGAIVTEYLVQCAIVKKTVVVQPGLAVLEESEDVDEDAQEEEEAVAAEEDSTSDEDDSDDESQGEDAKRGSDEATLNDDYLVTACDEDRLADEEEDKEPKVYLEDVEGEPEWSQAYRGSATQCELRALQPACLYRFRLAATNSAGVSEWSEFAEAFTPSAPPASPEVPELRKATSVSLFVAWVAPACHGEPITGFSVEAAPAGDERQRISRETDGPLSCLELDDLRPDTVYEVRVAAHNIVGRGSWSAAAKLKTRPLPPAPPRLECVNSNHNSLKVKWGDPRTLAAPGGSSADADCRYTLEMENVRGQ